MPEVPAVPDNAAGLRAANARLRELLAERDAEIAVLREQNSEIAMLREQLAALKAQVEGLAAQVKSNSRNSSKPPSSDGLAKPASKSLRGKTGRRPGRPKGQPGATVQLSDHPDKTVRHRPAKCGCCGKSLKGAPVTGTERRQVIDIPPVRAKITEHRILTLRCGCGRETKAQAPGRGDEPGDTPGLTEIPPACRAVRDTRLGRWGCSGWGVAMQAQDAGMRVELSGAGHRLAGCGAAADDVAFANRFLDHLQCTSGPSQEHLARTGSAAARTLEWHPDFLRLLIVFAVQPPAAGEGEIQAVVRRIREHALELLRAQIASAFGDDPPSPVTDLLARFALAAIDGAFVACQADRRASLEQLLQPLPAAITASRRSLLGKRTDDVAGPASRRCPGRRT